MSLNHFMQPKKKRPVLLKAALRRMRAIWLRGPVDRFDLKLAKILGYSIPDAEIVRESWVKMGFLAYDERGLLCWRSGGV